MADIMWDGDELEVKCEDDILKYRTKDAKIFLCESVLHMPRSYWQPFNVSDVPIRICVMSLI